MTAIPAPGPPRPIVFPSVCERTIAGIRVAVVAWGTAESPLHVPLVATRFVFRGGATGDPPDRAGTASLAASVAPLGAGGYSAVDLARAADTLGARIECGAGYDVTTASLGTSSATFSAGLELLADVVSRPQFLPAEIERTKVRAQSELRLAVGSPSSLARLVLARAAFGEGRYGRPASGTPRSLERIERSDLAAFARAVFGPEGTTLIVAGAIDPATAFDLAQRTFADWPAQAAAPTPVPAVEIGRGRAIVVDQPDAGRTAVIAGVAAPARAAADHDAAVVTTAILSGYSGRLNAEIRVKRGLSYGAGAQYVARRDAGLLLASTLVDHARTIETYDVIRSTFDDLTQRHVAAAELERRTTSILGAYYRSVETADGIAANVSELAAFGLPFDELAAHPQRVLAVGAERVLAFSRAYLDAPPFAVFVGDARAFARDLEGRFERVDVVPFAKLDLDSPTLGA